MVIRPDLDEFMVEVRKHLPPGFDFEVTARMRGAFTRAREVKSATALFRLALAFGGCGMSLRETCAWSAAAGLADLADTSLLERLCKAAPWLGDVVAGLIARQAQVPVGRWAGYRLRALDGTSICQPGADRTTWRLHVGYDLATGQADQIVLTDGCGAENLQRLVYRPGDIVLADRCYARPRDLRPVIAAGAHFIVRMGWNALRLSKPDGTPFDLFAALAVQTAQEGEVPVRLDDGAAAEPLLLRLVIRRKSNEEAEAEKKRLIKDAKKRGKTPDPRSLQAAHYILLLTALPASTFPAADVLALYRFRWQLELAFKRMKSLAGLDQLAAKKPELAQAWIYARLIVFLIAEQNAGQVPDSPPCGPDNAPREPTKTRRQPIKTPSKSVTLAPDQNGIGQHPVQHSRDLVMAKHLQCLHPHSPPHR
jgi:Transposase DDE domain